MINFSLKEKEFIVKNILRLLPKGKIIAFGSRIQGTAKKYSDLDIAIFQEQKIPLRVLSNLSEFFSESELPYKIDLVDGTRIDEEFRELIKKNGEIWVFGE